MLFKPEHIEQIRSGEKTVTRRDWERTQVREGGVYIASTEMFTSHDEADCYIQVTDVREEPLGALTPDQADREGGYTVEEFEEVWREINGSYDPYDRITVVEFEYVGRTHPDHEEGEQTVLTDGGKSPKAMLRWIGDRLVRLGRWLGAESQSVKIEDYKGSTALIIQNDRDPDMSHVFYVSKWEAPCDGVVERLEGTEYQRVDHAE